MRRWLLDRLTPLSLLLWVAAACITPGCARRVPAPAYGILEVTLSNEELAEPPVAVGGVEELRRHVGRTVTLEGRAGSAWKSPNELVVPHWADRDWEHVVHMGGLIAPGLDGRRIRVRMTLREGEAVSDPGSPNPPAAAAPPTATTRPYRHRYRYLYPDPDAVLVGLWDGQQWQPRREWLSPETAARHRARSLPPGE